MVSKYLDSKFSVILNAYCKYAQVLGLGESTMSFDKIKEQASFYKTKIQDAEKKPTPGWKQPGTKALEALDKIMSGGQVDSELKDWAKLDISTNFRTIFTEAEIQQFDKIIDNYNGSL